MGYPSRTTHTDSRASARLDTTSGYPASQGEMLLGRYRVMDARGTGGFGTVLTCWDTRLQRRVAIKRMPLTPYAQVPGVASTIAEALAEARTSCLLAHPNIVTVFDFENDDECAYLVMEYVDGITLAELLSRVEGGVLTPDECAYLVSSLGDALAFAHENGVLHLDIKPTNIMISRNGQVKLCDFGMATLASATGYGDARGGTVGYMPPEQIEGGLVDERTDVFSLGVVTWQALTGESPFAAPTAEQSLRLIQRGPKTKLSRAVPDAGGMTEEALRSALAPSPYNRTPSVADFTAEVTFVLGDVEEGAASIRYLLAQTGEAAETDNARLAADLPLAFRYPWIEDALVRIVSVACVAWLMYSVGRSVLPTDRALLIVGGICCCLTAIWPTTGSALLLTLFAVLLGTATTGSAPILLSSFFGLFVLVWWATIGARERHATPAVLLPLVSAHPLACAAWAGAFLRPAQAFATAGFSWMATHLYLETAKVGYVALDALPQLLALGSSPSVWIAGAGCALAATIAAAIARIRPSTSWIVAGQCVGMAVLVGSQVVAQRVENGGIWVAPTWDTAGIAVVLWVLACIAAVLCGPKPQDQEVDFDELA